MQFLQIIIFMIFKFIINGAMKYKIKTTLLRVLLFRKWEVLTRLSVKPSTKF